MKPVFLTLAFALFFTGCNTIKTEHTVNITMDVNVKLDRELDDFFGDIDGFSEPAGEEAE